HGTAKFRAREKTVSAGGRAVGKLGKQSSALTPHRADGGRSTRRAEFFQEKPGTTTRFATVSPRLAIRSRLGMGEIVFAAAYLSASDGDGYRRCRPRPWAARCCNRPTHARHFAVNLAVVPRAGFA